MLQFPCSLSVSFFSFALFSFLPECVSTTHVLAEVCFVCRMFFFLDGGFSRYTSISMPWWLALSFDFSFLSFSFTTGTNELEHSSLFWSFIMFFLCLQWHAKVVFFFLVSILLNEQRMSLEWLVSPHRMLLCICATSVFFSSWCVSGFSFRLLFALFCLYPFFLKGGVCNKQAKNASASKLVTCISRRPNGVCVDMMIIDWSSLTPV